jgi:hypothetical protein
MAVKTGGADGSGAGGTYFSAGLIREGALSGGASMCTGMRT